MKLVKIASGTLVWTGIVILFAGLSQAQTKAGGAAPAQTKGKAAAPAGGTPANLGQLMKGIMFPNSNLIFFAQSNNPGDVKSAKDPATAVNPFENSYGQWQAVENAGLALAEGSRLLTVPGRKCANGLNVPMSNPDWPGLVQGLREAGLKVYAAAKAKNMDQILDAADVMTTACSNCHEKYRDKGGLQDRCK
jgi:hypothetical protein